jgi:chromosomal replication initiation ATPase DnaA
VARLKIFDPKLRARPVVEAAADVCGLSYRQVMARRRLGPLVEARHMAMLALRRAGWSYPQIAAGLDLKDHTTCLHGVREALKRERADPGFSCALKIVERARPKEK